MAPVTDLLREAGQALLNLFTLPYFYIAILLVYWHARQGSSLQRRLFHVRMYSSIGTALVRVGAGLAAGVVLSLIGLLAGAHLTADAIVCVWAAMLVLAIVRFRYVCLGYAAGLLGVAQAIVTAIGVDSFGGAAHHAALAIHDLDMPGLLFLAGILHIAEGVLVRVQGAKRAIPLFLEGKRGKPIGAYSLTGLWPVPLLWLVPAAGAGGGVSLPWTPLFGMGHDPIAWSMLAFPVLIGFSDRTEANAPKKKARLTGNALVGYGIVLAVLAAGAETWSPLTVVAAVAAFVLHEGLLLWSRRQEEGRPPLYAQGGRGVRLLAVLPGTPAAEMGLEAGEVIVKANGVPVRTKEELHAALQKQSAFCRLEVLNLDDQIKFAQRARYAGEHHQLGLILAPDESAEFVAAPRSASIWQGLQHAGARRRKGMEPLHAATAANEMAATSDSEAETEAAAAETEAAPETPPFEEAQPVVDPGLPPRGKKKG